MCVYVLMSMCFKVRGHWCGTALVCVWGSVRAIAHPVSRTLPEALPAAALKKYKDDSAQTAAHESTLYVCVCVSECVCV
jgi:hypothetical protein